MVTKERSRGNEQSKKKTTREHLPFLVCAFSSRSTRRNRNSGNGMSISRERENQTARHKATALGKGLLAFFPFVPAFHPLYVSFRPQMENRGLYRYNNGEGNLSALQIVKRVKARRRKSEQGGCPTKSWRRGGAAEEGRGKDGTCTHPSPFPPSLQSRVTIPSSALRPFPGVSYTYAVRI